MDNLQSADQAAVPERRSFLPPRRVVVVAAAALAALAGAVVLRPQPAPLPEPRAAESAADPDDITDPVVTNPGYVGPDACIGCHADRVSATGTKHFRACREPRADEMPAGFRAGRGTVPTRVPGLRFEMVRRGDEFVQVAVQATPRGEERTEARIGLVYGSAPADEVYHLWRGDRLYESKVAWLHPLGQWGHGTLDPHAPGDRSRETTTRCVECHNTWLGHVPGTAN